MILKKGNCLDLMNDIGDETIDMIFCDLPYGMTNCKWDSIIPLDILWNSYKRIIKRNGVIILTGSQPFTSVLVCSNLKMFKHEWIWEKSKASNFLNAKYQPMKIHENILIFCKGKLNYNPIKTKSENKIRNQIRRKQCNSEIYNNVLRSDYINTDGLIYPKSIQKFKNANTEENKSLHPTQKPIALIEYFIKTFTNENDLILDNCMGSGTTGIACLNTNRNFIGFELNDEYFEIAKNRIENHKQIL